MKIKPFIYSPCFAGPTSEQRIMHDPAPIPRADVSWYFRLDETCEKARPKNQLLTASEERTLFLQYNYARWRSHRADTPKEKQRWHAVAEEKKATIVEYNLALVVSMISRNIRGNSEHFADFLGECNQRLIRAVELFEVDRGWKFSTYACSGIINQAKRLADRAQRRSMVELPDNYSPATDPVADRREEDAQEARDERITRVRAAVAAAGLSDVERFIIEKRFLDEAPMTLEAVGAACGFSKERARQIQVIALDKIKNAL